MIEEAYESVQHCLCMTKSSSIDLLWSLSWMHVWSWGLNLWPVALALGWPFAWGRMLWTGVCRCGRIHFGSFWAFCNGISAWCPLILVELPRSLSINCFTNPYIWPGPGKWHYQTASCTWNEMKPLFSRLVLPKETQASQEQSLI